MWFAVFVPCEKLCDEFKVPQLYDKNEKSICYYLKFLSK